MHWWPIPEKGQKTASQLLWTTIGFIVNYGGAASSSRPAHPPNHPSVGLHLMHMVNHVWEKAIYYCHSSLAS
jgi:hypothetical protein